MEVKELLDKSYKRNYKHWVDRLARNSNITREMAEDIVQDACVSALTYADSFKSTAFHDKVDSTEDEKFDAWFDRIIRACQLDVIAQDKSGGMTGRSL